MAAPANEAAIVAPVLGWFDVHGRDLPWRGTHAWGVLVSEVMLQQTPVARVLPAWAQWLTRWPTPTDLADAAAADAIRAWGRLGYPRRARYLHAGATRIRDLHAGRVPADVEALRALPGVGDYTAAAVLAFAFTRRSIVLDTNVRRVLARAITGTDRPRASISAVERRAADATWPVADDRSARWSAAVMELGALVCTARAPKCEHCPISGQCSWLARGRPHDPTPRRRAPGYAGSDRQARGTVLAAARASHEPISRAEITADRADADQLDRAVAGLLADGLLEVVGADLVQLPQRAAAKPG